MREVLFRGKRLDNGEWVEGSLFVGDNGECEICYGTPRVRITYHVDPATVGQYTGLKDKNGKRIFEGDVVYSIYSKKNYPVLFGEFGYINENGDEEGACGWYNEEIGYGYKTAFADAEEWALIVGTIHDNPELLQKTQELEVL